jgi:hypothetical protein
MSYSTIGAARGASSTQSPSKSCTWQPVSLHDIATASWRFIARRGAPLTAVIIGSLSTGARIRTATWTIGRKRASTPFLSVGRSPFGSAPNSRPAKRAPLCVGRTSRKPISRSHAANVGPEGWIVVQTRASTIAGRSASRRGTVTRSKDSSEASGAKEAIRACSDSA